MMCSLRTARRGFAWLELLVAIAILALLFQLFPSLRWAVDMRNWSRSTWLLLNFVVVLILIGIRFGPGVFSQWSERRKLLADEKAKAEKQRETCRQREALERMAESRKRRMY